MRSMHTETLSACDWRKERSQRTDHPRDARSDSHGRSCICDSPVEYSTITAVPVVGSIQWHILTHIYMNTLSSYIYRDG
jgi:hypothetical protein